MDNDIVPNLPPVCTPRHHLRRKRRVPAVYNPIRRLVAAVVLRAVEDFLFPAKNTPRVHRQSAAEFLDSDDGQYLLAQLLGKAVCR